MSEETKAVSQGEISEEEAIYALTAAITAPARVSPTPKVSRRMRGMMPSYTCQKAEMAKKASPTRKVRL